MYWRPSLSLLTESDHWDRLSKEYDTFDSSLQDNLDPFIRIIKKFENCVQYSDKALSWDLNKSFNVPEAQNHP